MYSIIAFMFAGGSIFSAAYFEEMKKYVLMFCCLFFTILMIDCGIILWPLEWRI